MIPNAREAPRGDGALSTHVVLSSLIGAIVLAAVFGAFAMGRGSVVVAPIEVIFAV